MATSISTYCGEHLWAAPKQAILGAGGHRLAPLAHRIRPAAQRQAKQTTIGVEQQKIKAHLTNTRKLYWCLLDWSSWRSGPPPRQSGAELVYSEKQSGIKTDRAALARLMASLEPGDVVLVTKLDRLARSTRDLLNTLATIGEAGGELQVAGRSLGGHYHSSGRLMLTVLGGLAEFERHLILSRTNEGRVRAKARGVRFGRKPKLTKHQQTEALARIAQGETLTAIARSYNVSHMTISRLAGVAIMQ